MWLPVAAASSFVLPATLLLVYVVTAVLVAVDRAARAFSVAGVLWLMAIQYDSLCTRKGLVIDQSTPIRCTSNSTVYAARSPIDGQKWAIKVTPNKRRIVEEYEKRQQLRDSPYLLKSVSVQQSPTKAMLQMELCEHGDLRNVMLDEPDIWQLVHDIGAGLARVVLA
jgi:hypothetical protein